MKTIEEVDRFFIENKISVSIFAHSIKAGLWYMTAEKATDGVALKVTQEGDDLLEILILVAEKFEQFVRRGAPSLLAPQLEHVSKKKFEYPNDEIPF